MSKPTSIPAFSELPLDKTGPRLNAWGLYGPDDQLGTLNRLTDDVVKSAASEIRSGTRVNLDWPLDAQGDLPFFGRRSFTSEIVQLGDRTVNDDIWHFNTQASSQWDGFRHCGYQEEKVFYNGVTMDQIHGRNGTEKSKALGIDAWVHHGGIVGRGILLDYHAWRLKEGIEHNAFATQTISLESLKRVAAHQGTEIRFGDILLIRSGYMEAYHQLDREQISHHHEHSPNVFAGVEASEGMLEFLWENFSAAGADHPAFEAFPPPGKTLHEVMLAGWGMPIGELFDLRALAEQCQKAQRWSFFLCSQPTLVPGGVASPPNVVAIF